MVSICQNKNSDILFFCVSNFLANTSESLCKIGASTIEVLFSKISCIPYQSYSARKYIYPGLTCKNVKAIVIIINKSIFGRFTLLRQSDGL